MCSHMFRLTPAILFHWCQVSCERTLNSHYLSSQMDISSPPAFHSVLLFVTPPLKRSSSISPASRVKQGLMYTTVGGVSHFSRSAQPSSAQIKGLCGSGLTAGTHTRLQLLSHTHTHTHGCRYDACCYSPPDHLHG